MNFLKVISCICICSLHPLTLLAQNPTDNCINETQIDFSVPCNFIYNPVCGCDNITYENNCIAENQGGVTSWEIGECPEHNNCIDSALIDLNLACTEIYDPVCGCDGVTYGNGCVAEIVFGISFYTMGECNTNTSNCIDSSFINPNLNCTTIYDPVCGCDGVTYGNACVATTQFGVVASTPGECVDVSITNLKELNDISIYPIPSSDILNIRFKENELDHFDIFLIDLQGDKVFVSQNIVSKKYSIPLKDFSNGIYILKISNKTKIYTQKIIIQK